MRGYGTNASNFVGLLSGRTITDVWDTGDSDCGLVLFLDNGLCLRFGYSSCEGSMLIVDKEGDLVETESEDGFPLFSLREGLK